MADLQKTVEVVFSALDQTGAGFQSVSSNIDALAADVGKVTGPIADVTKDLLALEAAVAAVGVGVLLYSTNAAVKFQSAQIDLLKVLSDSETDVDDYAASITDLSQTYGVLGTNTTQVVADFKQAGFSIEEALTLTENALTAVKVSELSTDEASRVLIATLKGFGLEVSDTNHILDSLNEVSNNNAASFGELGTAVADVAPVAKAAGLSFDELVAFVTPIIEIFGSGSEAARGLRTVLLQLADPTTSVASALGDVGISLTELDGSAKSSKDLLEELAAVWPTLTQETQTYTAANIAGKDQAAKFIALMEGWPTIQNVVSDSINSSGSAAKELEVRLGAAEEVINRAKVSFQATATAIGNQFLPQMTGIVGASGELGQAFTQVVNSGGLEPLFNLLRPLLADFESDLISIAENLPAAFEAVDWTALVNAFGDLGQAVSDLFGNIDLTTAEGLGTALQTLVDVGATMLEWTAGVVEGLEPFASLLGEVVSAVGDLNPEIAQTIGNIAGFATGLDTVLPLVSGVTSVLSGLADGVILLAGAKALGVLPSSLAASGSALATFGASAAGVTAAVAGGAGIGWAIGTVLKEAIDYAIPGVDTLGTKIYELVNGDQDAWITQTTQVADGLANQSGEVENTAKSMDELRGETEGLKLAYEGINPTIENGALIIGDYGHSAEETDQILRQFYGTATDGKKDFDELTASIVKQSTENGVLRTTYVDASGAIRYTSEVLKEQKPTLDEGAKSWIEAQKVVNDFEVAMEEIASNERIKNFEISVDLQIAQLEADTERFKSVFDSIDNVVSSTSDNIGSLVGDLAGVFESSRTWQFIVEQIEKENDLREKALEQQAELIDAQVKYFEAKASALAKGDSLITIEADGLEPELEAFMFQILERIQVRANEEGQEWLLGCSA